MIEHPPRTWMMGFVRGKLSPRKRRAYVAHLLGGCEPCREEIAPIAERMFRPYRAVEPEKGGAEYDGPIDRAVLSTLERARERKREREAAEASLPEILASGGRSGVGAWTWGLCEVLVEKSADFRHEDSRKMLRLAELACEAAERLDHEVYGRQQVFDMRGRCWGEYASACRHHDALSRADWCLQRALSCYKQGSGSPILRARLAEVAAGILTHQRSFERALRALDLAFKLYTRQGLLLDSLRVLIGRGICTGRSGDPEMALFLLSQALIYAAEHGIRDARLSFITLHNILLFRVEHGNFAEARRQLFEMRPFYARFAGSVDALKLRGIEARIAAGLGDFERAERGFREIREEFNRRGQVYHSAIAGLDLSAVWLQQGKLADVKKMVAEILDIFRTRSVAREFIAAMLILREALERDRATRELIRSVANLIELHQSDDSGHSQC